MVIANLSGGRDSTAAIVSVLEQGEDIDYIVFCDTGFEFKEMYNYIDKLDSYLQKRFDKQITRIDKSTEIEKWAFSYPIQKGAHKGKLRGLPRIIGHDYCTRETKANAVRDFVYSKLGTNKVEKLRHSAIIGYTYNEVESGRISVLSYAKARYPLHELGFNEAEVSEFLQKRGIMNPLYTHFHRTGCYICPKQSKKAFFSIYTHYPDEWDTMKQMEARAQELSCVNTQFRIDKTCKELEKEFQKEAKSLFDDLVMDYDFTCFCK